MWGYVKPAGITPIDRRRHLVHANGAADHSRIAAEAALPHAVRQDHHRRRAGLIVFGQEVAADDGRRPQQRKRVGADPGAAKQPGRAAFLGQRHGRRRSPRRCPPRWSPARASRGDREATTRWSVRARRGAAPTACDPVRGTGRSRTSAMLTSSNTVVVTPMPRPSARIAASAKRRSRSSMRSAKRRSLPISPISPLRGFRRRGAGAGRRLSQGRGAHDPAHAHRFHRRRRDQHQRAASPSCPRRACSSRGAASRWGCPDTTSRPARTSGRSPSPPGRG